jgi:outer membrane protein TolC
MRIPSIGVALLLVTSGASAAPRTLSLDDALAEFDRQNLSLAQAQARADQAAATARLSQTALLPTLVASGNYVRNSDEARMDLSRLPLPPNAGVPSAIVMQPLEAFSAAGTLRVPIIVPSAWFDVAAAREGVRAAEASTGAIRAQLRTGLAQAAYGAVAIEEVVTASERAVATATEHAKSAERRVKAGTSPPLDSLRAQAEQVRRESDLARARADLSHAELALGVLLGRAEQVRVMVPPTPDPILPTGGTAALADEALARRPEMQAQRAQVDAARAQLRSSWARFAPQLFATGSIFASDTPYITGKKDGWRVTLELSWPLYDGGVRYAKKQQAEAAISESNAGSNAQRLTVIQQIEDASRDMSVARERLRLGEAQQKLAADAAASAQRSFDAGVATSLDTLDANDRLYQADVGLADARARLAQAVLALAQALGRTR